MTAVRVLPNESAAEILRNASQILVRPFPELKPLDVSAVARLIEAATRLADDTELSLKLSRSIVDAKEKERLELIDELREAHEEIERLTARLNESNASPLSLVRRDA